MGALAWRACIAGMAHSYGNARGEALPPEISAARPSVEEIERAVAACILGHTIEPIAATLGLSPEALTVWVQRYRAAGSPRST